MSDLNVWTGVGRATRDAELKYTKTGMAVLSFSIAVNRSIPPRDGGDWKNDASFFDVSLFGKAAESKANSILKGKQIGISGRLQQDRWEQDGAARSKVYIVAESVQVLGGSKSENGPGQAQNESGESNYDDSQQSRSALQLRRNAASSVPSSSDDFADDIPF